jgi:hypothetical protein
LQGRSKILKDLLPQLQEGEEKNAGGGGNIQTNGNKSTAQWLTLVLEL